MNERVSHQDIAEHMEGIADKATSRRVLRAALTQPAVREQLAALSTILRDDIFGEANSSTQSLEPEPVRDSDLARRAERLKAALRNATLAVALEPPVSSASPETVAVTAERAAGLKDRILQIGRQLLTLPCLAPATASSTPDRDIQRQILQTGDGVRIEFQQLPGSAPYRLRVVVDASGIDTENESRETYSVAYLTLEDSRDHSGNASAPDRHVLIVPLNDQARGFADFVIGSLDDREALPAPTGACRLVSATLAHLPPEQKRSA